MEEYTITAYEAERNARIARNRQRMMELNIPDLVRDFQDVVRATQGKKKQQRVRKDKCPNRPIMERRRSGRLQNQPAPCYNEAALDKADAPSDLKSFCIVREEVYTEEHIRLLGHCKVEWPLFVDGYSSDGTRVYDKLNGQTCHQCRQKTIGLRTQCSKCSSHKGVFCGDCLYMRYGENIKEAQQNSSWTCPDCRGICNCSICRNSKGFAPTGTLYRRAISAGMPDYSLYILHDCLLPGVGYASVAHMLVMQNQAKPEPASQAMLPAELRPKVGDAGLSESEKPPNQVVEARHRNSPSTDGSETKQTGAEETTRLDAKPTTRQKKISNMLPQKRLISARKAIGKPKTRAAVRTIGLAQQF